MEEEPLLPGSLAPTDGRVPLAYIYQPSPSAMQSALPRRRQPEWVLEFEPCDRKEVEPLMGGRPPATRSPRSIGCASPDRQSAIEFAERHGWKYVAPPPPVRSFRIKSYADNFR
jgi:ETC complex I subunit conserved region